MITHYDGQLIAISTNWVSIRSHKITCRSLQAFCRKKRVERNIKNTFMEFRKILQF